MAQNKKHGNDKNMNGDQYQIRKLNTECGTTAEWNAI